MTQILKIALFILLAIFIVFIVFAIVLLIGWKWWVGIFITIGLAGVGLSIVLLRMFLLRNREKRFVQQVIAQDESYGQNLSAKEKGEFQDLQAKWKDSITALRKSHLKQYGNPLYVLPWYMIFGESGSGKTTAIQSAKLSSPFAEVNRTAGISGTKNCDWWFFEQAIIIDTAGRYAIPVDEGRDKDEWQKFLSLLAKFRKKEPLNGLVVTVAADHITSSNPETLEEEGKSIRRRIDELMRVLGAKFPVYVLVTKCDLIQGMTRFCEELPEDKYSQAMGGINEDLSTDVGGFAKGVMDRITDRLRDIRLLIINKSGSKTIDPGLLLFPEEFQGLEQGLTAFVKSAFQESTYQETPILRGVFFSSGKQEGSPYSHFLKELGMIGEQEMLPGTDKGLFLHDLFSRIMPSDRGLFAPTQYIKKWSRLTQNLGIMAWLAIAVALCGLLSFSFVKNLKFLRDASKEISEPVIMQEELVTDVINLERFLDAVLLLEKRNQGWWAPRFGLGASKDVENDLKTKYSERFRDGFLKKFDENISKMMIGFSSKTYEQTIAEYAAHLVRRLNLLETRMEGKDIDELIVMPQPSYAGSLLTYGERVIPEIDKKLSGLYLHYVAFTEDVQLLNEELNSLHSWLKHILTLEGSNLNWIVTWVNGNPDLSAITLKDFWGGSSDRGDEIRVDPAFTQKGKITVDAYMLELEKALFDSLIIAGKKADFRAWYSESYFEAWDKFGKGFDDGKDRLADKEEWSRVASTIGTDKNPHFSLLSRIAEEITPFSDDPQLPPWLSLIYPYKDMELEASGLKEDESEKSGVIDKTARKVKTGVLKQTGKVGKSAGKLMDPESRVVAAKSVLDYKNALAEVALTAASIEAAYQAALAVYNEDPATGESPYFIGWRALEQLRSVMHGNDTNQEGTFWKLMEGPLDFMLSFISNETACRIQKDWEGEVLMEVQGVSNRTELIQLLLGKDGYAQKFIKGPAEPFIDRNLKKGFHAKEVLNNSVPFDDIFFSFLNKGTEVTRPIKSSYTVTIQGEPTSANKEAEVIPHATVLELQCSNETIEMSNHNFPVRKKFKWSPKSCEDVTFKILVGDVELIKKYTGSMAFASFLSDFEKGTRTFYPKEFPDEKTKLGIMGIRFITVKYRLNGHRPVIAILRRGPGQVPREIVQCWDQ